MNCEVPNRIVSVAACASDHEQNQPSNGAIKIVAMLTTM
jgi:hypothetical protein